MSVSPVEWASLIGVGGAVAGAAVGGFITFRVTARQVATAKEEGKLQRDHDEAQRRTDRKHEILMAREQRELEHKADAYMKIATYLNRSLHWARMLTSDLNLHNLTKPPVVPSSDEGLIAGAAGFLYLSDEATELLDKYDLIKEKFAALFAAPESTFKSAVAGANLNLRPMEEAAEAVMHQMRDELSPQIFI